MSVTAILLNPLDRDGRVDKFEEEVSKALIGQDRVVKYLTNLYQAFLGGLLPSDRPLGTLLFLGPTGSGKTRAVEVMADVLFKNADAFLKVDCAEFQSSHEISKLIGSPPGYLGHRETKPRFTQEILEAFCTEDLDLNLVLFDEIEKSSPALWQLLLGILDKAVLTLGDNKRVNFSHSVIFMTSNLGAREIDELIGGGIGFAPPQEDEKNLNVDQKIYRVALEAAKRKFSPEFMNRIDKVIVFRTLKEIHLRRILAIELDRVQSQLIASKSLFMLNYSDSAKDFILKVGTDRKYGARELRRAIGRYIIFPLSSLIATKQVKNGYLILVDYLPDHDKERLVFIRIGENYPIEAFYDNDFVSSTKKSQPGDVEGIGTSLKAPQTRKISKKAVS